MADERIKITLVTADRTRKAEVTLPGSLTVAELIAECRSKWNFPNDFDVVVTDRGRSAQLNAKQTLSEAGVREGATLEVLALARAGGVRR